VGAKLTFLAALPFRRKRSEYGPNDPSAAMATYISKKTRQGLASNFEGASKFGFRTYACGASVYNVRNFEARRDRAKDSRVSGKNK